MNEERKQKEVEHYDKLAREWRKEHEKENEWKTDIENYDINLFLSYQFLKKLVKENTKAGMKFLDYGCGHGMHTILPAKLSAEVYGIDLSEESLKIAQERAEKEGVADKIKFLKMDAEKLEFPDNYFDVVFDGGTFSSIDINKAYSEIGRVLKPGGKLIGIETFGHNPLANFKRWLNRITGKRTGWAASHIMKIKDLNSAREYFAETKSYYFHFLSMFIFPFRRLPGGSLLFRILDRIDSLILKILPRRPTLSPR